MISKTPNPPYYAVIFTSIKADYSKEYDKTTKRMITLASKQQGFLGIESARDEIGITVSYWDSLESIKNWKNEFEHKIARQKGKDQWYSKFKVRIALVERDYGFIK